LLFRQIHPSFIDRGRVTSQAFRPTSKDEGRLSAYNGDMITAEDSWRHYTSKGLKSAGVQAVTVQECAAEGLLVRPDPEEFPEHTVIDFTHLSPNQVERKSKRLQRIADARGWQYQP